MKSQWAMKALSMLQKVKEKQTWSVGSAWVKVQKMTKEPDMRVVKTQEPLCAHTWTVGIKFHSYFDALANHYYN